MMKLWRSAAAFTTLKGSDRVIHAKTFPVDQTPEALELYEVMMLRRIRRAIHDRVLTKVESAGGSFYLFIGSVLYRLLNRPGAAMARVCHLRVRFAPAFEALKLLSQGKQGQPISNDFWCVSHDAKAQFASLHRTFEHLPSSVILGVVHANQSSGMRSATEEFPNGDLIVVDLFKSTSDSIVAKLTTHFGDREHAAPVLLIARVAIGLGIEVIDVIGRQQILPSLSEMSAMCAQCGVSALYTFFGDFDRSYFLPFDGDYGVFIGYFAKRTANLDPSASVLHDLGFRELTPTETSTSTMVAPASGLGKTLNYYATFSDRLPLLDSYEEPDWRSWAKERDWDPNSVDWSTSSPQENSLIYSLYYSFYSPHPAALARQEKIHKQLHELAYSIRSIDTLGPMEYTLAGMMVIKRDTVLGLSYLLWAFEAGRYDTSWVRIIFHRILEFATADISVDLQRSDSVDKIVDRLLRTLDAMKCLPDTFHAEDLFSKTFGAESPAQTSEHRHEIFKVMEAFALHRVMPGPKG